MLESGTHWHGAGRMCWVHGAWCQLMRISDWGGMLIDIRWFRSKEGWPIAKPVMLPISLLTLLPWVPPPSHSLALCFITSHQACSRCGGLESIWTFATSCFLQAIPDTFRDTYPHMLMGHFFVLASVLKVWSDGSQNQLCWAFFSLLKSFSVTIAQGFCKNLFGHCDAHAIRKCEGASTLWGKPLTNEGWS